ncbi:dTDP-4-dehydrorhamnose reductase [Corynebacterium pygosceleis]|uniref:dTDP-4-dehydrorhamnose reductase n=1 Tax=Corynebacterium pygosceleis TaxID=2800406 RepID=A0A9Q4C7Q0_9CORY|nr:dTDP-4-dehydrorhamnose reductase [Corynebacterium pygosceleis]MCK7637692.1 dTDP-4-dehydrorhamnose reductase [Corynebacterium pygosceleis]MCK7674883.1 dTDP-4-dehydrorhamnose reductase [Corynebacterium pygosceleis]MCL0119528.1 dTDP-4-dehydrorhamnose reductase [Corynebacterium pygosceleis]MCX7467979.1 dTDP-4-dehydrorhamnose reductase [Corynebacterium pygosceleis]
MDVAVTGSSGQVASALKLTVPDGVRVRWLDRRGLDVTSEPDVGASAALAGVDAVINTAAFTDVDAAEDPARRDEVEALNVRAPELLARRCAETGARFIHLSTDYVFGATGGADHVPLSVDAPTVPDSVYGITKLAGERAARAVAENGDARVTVVRTAWVHSGAMLPDHRDFVGTMMRLAAGEGPVRVVDDQIGNPTYAVDLARGLWRLVADGSAPDGVLHAVGSGHTSWFGLARQVFTEAGADPGRVEPCSSAEFPRPAPRPAWSVLDTEAWCALGYGELPEWRSGVARAVGARL